MALVFGNAAEGISLAYMVNKAVPEDLVLRLYRNDVTPGETDTLATYQEATFSGYSAITLTGSSWVIVEGGPSQATYDRQSFTSDADQSAQLIYGYYFTRAVTGDYVTAERFSDGPYTIANAGDRIRVTSALTSAGTDLF